MEIRITNTTSKYQQMKSIEINNPHQTPSRGISIDLASSVAQRIRMSWQRIAALRLTSANVLRDDATLAVSRSYLTNDINVKY